MLPRKRPYVPKTKGCHPCARRRIHCDRRGPYCQKCEIKGLRCTGLSLELWVENPSAHHADQPTGFASQDFERPAIEDIVIDTADTLGSRYRQAEDVGQRGDWSSDVWSQEKFDTHYAEGRILPLAEAIMHTPDRLTHYIPPCQEDHDEPQNQSALMNTQAEQKSSDNRTWSSSIDTRLTRDLTDHVPLWKTQMCLHFSTHIAPEMVAVDGNYNEWRNLILPFAHQDDLVMNAIITVSSAHIYLTGSQQSLEDDAAARILNEDLMSFESCPVDVHRMYRAVFSGLRQTSEMEELSPIRKRSILMTLLVLLVGAMITGRNDFPILYRLLGSALEAMGGKAGLGVDGDTADFIMSQVSKFQFYGATLIDEEVGIQLISSSSHVARLLACLSRQSSENPEHRRTGDFIGDLTRQAVDMYREQALIPCDPITSAKCPTESDLKNSIVRVQHFKETLEALPADVHCEQVLIWATFIAASASLLEEHIRFFESILQRHYARNGFLNVVVGLQTLGKIWARNSSERWTVLIAQTNILVM